MVVLSIPTLDADVWRTTEPGTAPPASRLEAVRRLAEAGIHVGVGIAPILPGLSDVRAARGRRPRRARRRARDDLGEHREPATRGREHFLEALARDWPEQVDLYEALFASRAYLGAATRPDPRARATRRCCRPEPAQASAPHLGATAALSRRLGNARKAP